MMTTATMMAFIQVCMGAGRALASSAAAAVGSMGTRSPVTRRRWELTP